MKKILWILIGVIGSIGVCFIICLLWILFTRPLHKQLAFEYINAGAFGEAAVELPQIENWEISDYVDPDSVISFVNYSKTINFPSSILDSIFLYVSSELEVIGKKYYSENDYKHAISIFEQQLSWHEHYLGTSHLNHAILLNNLGMIYSDLGDNETAEKYYIASLELKQTLLGYCNVECASSLNNLGLLYYGIGNYPEAEKKS